MNQPRQKQLLEVPLVIPKTDATTLNNLQNSPSPSRASAEEMRVIPNQITIRRHTTANIQIHSPNVAACADFVPSTDCVERLYQVTDAILVICGVVVVISFVISLGISVLGISRIQQGLDFYTKTFGWE